MCLFISWIGLKHPQRLPVKMCGFLEVNVMSQVCLVSFQMLNLPLHLQRNLSILSCQGLAFHIDPFDLHPWFSRKDSIKNQGETLQCFIHSRWCMFSSINSIIRYIKWGLKTAYVCQSSSTSAWILLTAISFTKVFLYHQYPRKFNIAPWKMVVGRPLSYWEGNFSGALLNL